MLFEFPELAERVSSFALVVSEDKRATKQLTFAFELLPDHDPPVGVEELRERFLERLRAINQDFREASRFIPVESSPTLALHAAGTGPLADHDIRLKRHYVQEASAASKSGP